MNVYRWTFKGAIRLPLVKLINQDFEPLAAHLKLLDSPLQACYRVIDRIHTSFLGYIVCLQARTAHVGADRQKNIRPVLCYRGE